MSLREKPILLLDLDGPIIDVKVKMHQLYLDLVAPSGKSTISLPDYWEAKRNKTSENDILAKTNALEMIESYKIARKQFIESDQYLLHDVLQPDVVKALAQLQDKFTLILVTLRHNQPSLMRQLDRLQIRNFFTAILNNHKEVTDRWNIKVELIQNYLSKNSISLSQVYGIVGDTEIDILAGQNLGLRTFAVENGIRTKPLLEAINPQVIANDLNQISEIILSNC